MALFANRPVVVLKAMKEAGMNPNEIDSKGNTLLVNAMKSKQKSEVIKFFVDAGVNVNKPDEEKRTPLMLALYVNAGPEVVEALIEKELIIAMKTESWSIMQRFMVRIQRCWMCWRKKDLIFALPSRNMHL